MCHVEHFKYLLKLYQGNCISVEEHDELFDMIATSSYDQLVADAVLTDLQFGRDEDIPDLDAPTAYEIARNVYDTNKNAIMISA